MAEAHAKGHDYHLVDPSRWPALGGTSAFVLALGAVWWMHDGPPWVLLIGFLGILSVDKGHVLFTVAIAEKTAAIRAAGGAP